MVSGGKGCDTTQSRSGGSMALLGSIGAHLGTPPPMAYSAMRIRAMTIRAAAASIRASGRLSREPGPFTARRAMPHLAARPLFRSVNSPQSGGRYLMPPPRYTSKCVLASASK